MSSSHNYNFYNMSNINNIAYLLACEAIRRGSTDNVSVIIVLLK